MNLNAAKYSKLCFYCGEILNDVHYCDSFYYENIGDFALWFRHNSDNVSVRVANDLMIWHNAIKVVSQDNLYSFEKFDFTTPDFISKVKMYGVFK